MQQILKNGIEECEAPALVADARLYTVLFIIIVQIRQSVAVFAVAFPQYVPFYWAGLRFGAEREKINKK